LKDSKTLLEQLTEVSEKLKVASTWRRSRKHVDAADDNYVYEILCLFLIADAAGSSFRLTVAGKFASGPGVVALWPRSPGLKKNFSFFEMRGKGVEVTGNLLFQLCPGVKINDRHGKDRAPDANLLQGSATDNPSWKDLLACWDAKFVLDPVSRLADSQVSDFIHTHQQLGAPTAPPSWVHAIAGPAFRCSGLLTNGRPSTEREEALSENGVQETSGFPNRPTTRPR
jgi:hypothetical protein